MADTESDDDQEVSGWALQSSLISSDTFGAGLPHNSESSEEEDGDVGGDVEGGERGDRAELEPASTRDSSVLFRRLDSGAGALHLVAVQQAVRELWPQFDHEPALRRAFKASDRDSNGLIGRREFHLLLSNIVHFDALWKLFDTIEEGNAENRMELEDFQAACVAVAMQTSEGAGAEFREQARAEGVSSMHLGFDHFCGWMLAQKRQAHLTGGGAAAKRSKPAPPPARAVAAPARSSAARIGRASPQSRQSNSDTESDGDDDASEEEQEEEEEQAEPEPEQPAGYDSDSGDSELSDDDTAVALLARLQTSSLLGGSAGTFDRGNRSESPVKRQTSPVKPNTPARKAVGPSPVAPSPAQARLSQLLDELGSSPPGRGRAAPARSAASSATREYESPHLKAKVSAGTPSGSTSARTPPRSARRRPSDSPALPDSATAHDRLYAHKTAVDNPLGTINLAKHGLNHDVL